MKTILVLTLVFFTATTVLADSVSVNVGQRAKWEGAALGVAGVAVLMYHNWLVPRTVAKVAKGTAKGVAHLMKPPKKAAKPAGKK